MRREKGISTSIPPDSEGFLDRTCPNCQAPFAIHMEQYAEGAYVNLRCPYCRWIEDLSEFITPSQSGYARAIATNKARQMATQYAEGVIDEILGGIGKSEYVTVERSTKRMDFGRVDVPTPHVDSSLAISSCTKCGFQYKVVVEKLKTASCSVCR